MRGPRDQKSLEISNHLSIGCLRGGSAERIDPGRRIKSFRMYRFSVSLHGDFYGPLSRRADSPRELDEAERPGRMRGPHDQKSPETLNHFSLFGWLRGSSAARVDPGQRSKIFPNLQVGRFFFSRAVLYLDYSSDFSLWVFSNNFSAAVSSRSTLVCHIPKFLCATCSLCWLLVFLHNFCIIQYSQEPSYPHSSSNQVLLTL